MKDKKFKQAFKIDCALRGYERDGKRFMPLSEIVAHAVRAAKETIARTPDDFKRTADHSTEVNLAVTFGDMMIESMRANNITIIDRHGNEYVPCPDEEGGH